MKMEDKIGFLFFWTVVYLSLVLISILILTDIPREFEKNPKLINKKWKRILWTLSCLLFAPILMIAMIWPLFVGSEIRNFIKNNYGNADHSHGEKE
jgi:hypothetical protein